MDELPIYRRLVAAGSDPSDRTVTLALEADEKTRIRVDMAAGLVGPVMAALSAEAAKLMAVAPDDEASHAATLRVHAVWLSGTPGAPILVFELLNGSLLPLELGTVDLSGLAAEMALLAHRPQGHAH